MSGLECYECGKWFGRCSCPERPRSRGALAEVKVFVTLKVADYYAPASVEVQVREHLEMAAECLGGELKDMEMK